MIECKNLEEVRQNIDRIDREIVGLMAERSRYVKQAARFKKTDADVKDTKRVEEVIARVRTLAIEQGLPPGIVEDAYRAMISGFIGYEMRERRR
ncbi:MAG TPA: chorismate mutase [Candidatus Methanoperedenaceae archaeon]|nr:chorismate mutase [Candidatus Methanoperedenaceae archaeon]